MTQILEPVKKRRIKRRFTRLKSKYPDRDLSISPRVVDHCLEEFERLGIPLKGGGINALISVCQEVLHTNPKAGVALGLDRFSCRDTGRKVLDGFRRGNLIYCVDLDSWKPMNYDLNNAKARRFLPDSGLLLANLGPVSIRSTADYHARNWQQRKVRTESLYTSVANAPLALPSHLTGALNAGPGLLFDWERALPLISDLDETDRRSTIHATCNAVGYQGGEAALQTDWKQRPTGRTYTANTPIQNIPRIVRGALIDPSGGMVACVDYSNFEPRLAFEKAGITPPAGDIAANLAVKIGVTKKELKPILNGKLHGQTKGNVYGVLGWDAFRVRTELDELLQYDYPSLAKVMNKLDKESTYLQTRGAEIFTSALSEAIELEQMHVAGIPAHDGWTFAAKDQDQIERVKRIFENKAGQMVGFSMPVKTTILSGLRGDSSTQNSKQS